MMGTKWLRTLARITLPLAVVFAAVSCINPKAGQGEVAQVSVDPNIQAFRLTQLPSGTYDFTKPYQADPGAIAAVGSRMAPYEREEFGRMRRGPYAPMLVEEIKAIRDYTNSDYYEINKGLREHDMNLLAKHEPTIKLIASGLHRLPAFRGNAKRRATLPEEELAKFRPGAVYPSQMYMSTTRNCLADVTICGINFGNSHFQGLQSFHIRSLSGRDISGISSAFGEQEVLFLPGTVFRVGNVKEGDRRGDVWLTVDLEEIP